MLLPVTFVNRGLIVFLVLRVAQFTGLLSLLFGTSSLGESSLGSVQFGSISSFGSSGLFSKIVQPSSAMASLFCPMVTVAGHYLVCILKRGTDQEKNFVIQETTMLL